MLAGEYPIECEEGGDFELSLQYLDANDVPVDLSAYTARMSIYKGTVEWLSLTTVNGRIVLGVDGWIILRIPAATVATMPTGTATYYIELLSGDAVMRILKGTFTR